MSAGKLKKAQYYVWYLGWKECRGLAGREFTEPVARELLQRRTQDELPKLTIEVGKKELKITQLVEKKKGKIDKVKYPSISNRDITFAEQSLHPFEDVVSCIYLGYNDMTKCAAHVHVYRFDSPDTAAIFVNQLDLHLQIPEHQVRIRKIEDELAKKGHIAKRPDTRLEGYLLHTLDKNQNQQSARRSGDYEPSRQYQNNNVRHPEEPYNGNTSRSESSDNGIQIHFGSRSSGSESQSGQKNSFSPNSTMDRNPQTTTYPISPGSDRRSGSPNRLTKMTPRLNTEVDEGQQLEFESLAAELKSKLGKEPLLLPPKDYDTISRSRGNAFDIVNRKCLNQEIIGQYGYSANSNVHVPGEKEKSLKKQNSQSSFEYNRNSAHGSEEELSGYLNGSGNHSRQLSRDNSIPEDMLSQHVPPPARPFSPGPLTKELKENSYFPQKGVELPNYLQRSQGSHQSLNRYNSGEQSEDGDNPRVYPSPPGSKYSASTLGLAPKHPRILRKQQSSPEFGQAWLRRQRSSDGDEHNPRYPHQPNTKRHSSPPRSGHSSGSNTMSSNPYEQNNNHVDLAASMPAMKIKDYNRQNSKDQMGLIAPDSLVYEDDDPGAYVPIDYTVAVRGNKTRKAIP